MAITGDLNKYANEIGDIFIKCFSQLSVQIPILCTLLSVIARKNSSFAAQVVSKLFTEMMMSLKAGDVIVARNHLRSFACLTAARMISLNSDNTEAVGSSFLQLLLALVEIAEEENALTSTSDDHSLTVSSQAAIYLLAATVPFIASELHQCQVDGQDTDEVSSRIAALCRVVAPNTADGVAHKSLYDCNNTHSVFHVNIEGTQSPNAALDCFTRPISAANENSDQVHSSASSCPAGGSVCWDTLWETCRVADNILTAVHLTGGACYRYSEDKFGFDAEENVDYLPKCMMLIWRNADVQAELANPLAPIPELTPVESVVEVASASLEPDDVAPVAKPVEPIKPQYTNYTLSPLLLIQNNETTSPDGVAQDVRTAVRASMMTKGFSAMAGPEADYYRQPSDRDKTMSNSSAGYAAWVGLRLNLFDQDTVDETSAPSATAAITGLSFLELAFVRDFFRSTLRFFEPFMRDNGTSVGSFDLLFKHLTSVQMLFPTGMHLEYVLIETLLLMVVQVPPLNACLVQRVIMELCTRNPAVYAPVLAVGCNALFNLMPAMDVCAIRELSTLLSVYLTNKGRAWPYWSYWGEEYAEILAAEDNDNAQKIFLDMLLATLTRMSGYDQIPGDRMRAVLPKSMHSAISADESRYTPDCPLYNVDGSTRSRSPLAKEILDRLNQRLSPEEFSEWLCGPHDIIGDDETEGYRIRYMLQGLFVYVCENSGSPGGTLSAVRNVVERYRSTMVDVVASCEEGGHVLTEGIVICLHSQPALLDMFLDTVMRYGIMHPSDAAGWLCRDIRNVAADANPAVTGIHISNAATNPWVWAYVQTSVNRSLDMMKVAFNRRSAFVKTARETSVSADSSIVDKEDVEGGKRLKPSVEGAEALEVTIPESIAVVVESASEGCQEAFAVIVSALLMQIAARSKTLVEEGKEEEEEIKELDGQLITAVSMVHQVLRCFYLTEAVFSTMSLATNTSVVSLTTMETVESIVEESLGSADLVGVAGKIWRMFSTNK